MDIVKRKRSVTTMIRTSDYSYSNKLPSVLRMLFIWWLMCSDFGGIVLAKSPVQNQLLPGTDNNYVIDSENRLLNIRERFDLEANDSTVSKKLRMIDIEFGGHHHQHEHLNHLNNVSYTFDATVCNSSVDAPVPIVFHSRNTIRLLIDDESIFKRYLTTNHKNDVTFKDFYVIFFCIEIKEKNNITRMEHLGVKSKFSGPSIRGRIARAIANKKERDGTDKQMLEQQQQFVPLKHTVIEGMRVEHSDKEPKFTDDGVPELMAGSKVLLRLFGRGINENTMVTFTHEAAMYGGSCQLPVSERFRIEKGSVLGHTALVYINLPKGTSFFYICTKEAELENATQAVENAHPFVHQGSDSWLRLGSYEPFLALWVSIVIIVVCLMFSALFSGLNLGLMSLDRTELKILCNTGTENEKMHARKIQPVRDHGNYLLCSILLGNVLVNSTFTILLDGLTSGLVAVLCSTMAIVIFGEITPQAICSRHGLAVGAKTIFITKAVMLITFPLSYPTSKILDFLLGEEIGNVYNRERLKELVKVTKDINDLDKDEVNIISGALELRRKTVNDVMTHIEDAFMLTIDAVLDFETVSEIMKTGFSRIPVYEGDRKNIVTLLYIKDLAFLDTQDNTPLKTLCEFYQNPCHFVFEDVTLDIMFRQFKEGHKGHMAFVHRVNSEGDGDPFYETIGLVTLEDVIEELIQAEIMDETDVFTDNRTKVRRQRTQKKQDFTVFAERRENQQIRISPQLTLATFQYLSTTVDAFKPDLVSETILRRLLNQEIVHHMKCKGKEKTDPSIMIYQQGKPVNFFVLILEGRVEVTVGKENLVFESGPFTYFGTQALVQTVGVLIDSPQQPAQVMGSLQSLNMDAMLRHTFVPDYSVRATTEVVYITIKRTLYLAAKRATLMERSQKLGEPGSEAIDDEVEKLLHSLDEDDRSIGADMSNLTGHTPKTSKSTSHAQSPSVPVEIHDQQTTDLDNISIAIPGVVALPQHIINNNGRSLSIPNTIQMSDLEEVDTPLLHRSKS